MRAVLEVFWHFFSLGLLSFGGPAAHLGYFQKTFVQKLNWIEQASYARLIALSQFLPGPGSSQVGFALGLKRAGLFGGIAAFLGFTLPSFLLMAALAIYQPSDSASDVVTGTVHGLKLLAVVVVADAVLSMLKSFCSNRASLAIGLLAAAILLWFPGLWIQIGVLAIAALVGMSIGTPKIEPQHAAPNRIVWLPLIVFAMLLLALPLAASLVLSLKPFASFYQTGSLVFGGGHVVLPLLQQTIGDAITPDRFIAGYAAAQAVPGPMFSLASFLGAELSPANAWLGALIATLGIFLPGFLLVLSLHGAWESLAAQPKVAKAVWGINAAVVGLLLAALYNPIFTSAVSTPAHAAQALIGLCALRAFKLPIVVLVLSFSSIGYLMV